MSLLFLGACGLWERNVDMPGPDPGDPEATTTSTSEEPTLPASAPGRDEFCAEHVERPHTHDGVNHQDASQLDEHVAAMELVTEASATHVAVSCGDWSDPATWADGQVPTADADVLIPHDIGVTFDLDVSPPLRFMKVEGYLDVARTHDTQLRVDTLVGAPDSFVVMGTMEEPMPPSVTAVVSIVDNGPIDLDLDPLQLTRGVILHGTVSIHGAPRTPFLGVTASPAAGQRSLALERAPVGWEPGDTVLVVGTEFGDGDRRRGLRPSEDEVRTLASLDGTTAQLDAALAYDHDAPEGHGLHSYVANLTRSIRFESENPEGVPGHVMVMHSDAAVIRHAGFYDLGRSDRSRPVDEVSNPVGRYPLHVHRSGTDARQTVVIDGNVVQGGPGWGIVHHDSIAAVNHNVVFDIVGAGIVAEAGSEVGEWVGNLVTSVGGGTDLSVRDSLAGGFGPGVRGECFTLMSRAVYQHDNIAANCLVGWSFEGRIGRLTGYTAGGRVPARSAYRFDPLPLHDWERSGTNDEGFPDPDFLQFVDFRDNEAFAVDTALRSSHRGTWYRPHTDIINEIVGFRAWNARQAMDFDSYSWDYTVRDSLFLGTNQGRGAQMFTKVENFNFVDTHFDHYRAAIGYAYTNDKGVLHNVTFGSIEDPVTFDETGVPMPTLDQVVLLDRPSLELDPGVSLTLTPSTAQLTLTGRVIDSAGEYPFATYRHWDGRGDVTDLADWRNMEGYTVEFRASAPGGWSVEDLVSLRGALQRDDGSWVMPVAFWIGDRVTGRNHPVQIDFPLEGFDEALLEQHRIDSFTLPSPDVAYVADQLRSP